MKKALLFLLIASRLLAQEVWHVKSIDYTLGSVKVGINEEMRFAESLYYHHVESNISYRVVDWFTLDFRFRSFYGRAEEKWPHLNGIFSRKFGAFKVSDRNRIVYRIREGGNFWMYRNKATVTYKNYYVADEVFFDLRDGDFVRNRFYLGAFQKVGKFKVSMFYLRQTDKKDVWTGKNCFGFNIGASL